MEQSSAEAIKQTGLKHNISLSGDVTKPLVLLVHGKAGTCDVMKIFKSAFPDNCNFILPQAPLLDPIGGFSWWLENKEARYLEAGQQLVGFIDKSIDYYSLQPKKIIAAGFSQGGACLSVVSQIASEYLSALAMLASFYVEIGDVKPNSYPDFFIAHGYADEDVPYSQAVELVSKLSLKKVKLNFVAENVGHKLGTAGMKALSSWADIKCL